MKESSGNPQRIVRPPSARPETRFYDFEPFRLDARECVILRDGQPLAVTPKVFDLLLLFVRNPGRLMTKDEMFTSLWGDTVVEESNLSQNVFVLRKALGDNGEPHRWIETAPKLGYRFVASVTESNGSGEIPKVSHPAATEPKVQGLAPAIQLTAGSPDSPRPRRSLPLRQALLAASVLLAAGLWWWNRQPAHVEPPAFHRLGSSGRDGAPAASAEGRTVAFASDRDGRSRIWLTQLAGKGEYPFTPGPDDRPRFSPDGSALLFLRDEGTRGSLHSRSVLGGETRRILQDATDGDWAPDGRRIAFTRSGREKGVSWSAIGIASSDGGEPREIHRVYGSNLDSPRWSPDGRIIAARQAGGSTGVHDSILLTRPDGELRRSLIPAGKPGRVSSLAWSPSGTDILYGISGSLTSTSAGVSTRIVRFNIETGKSQTLFWVPERVHAVDILGRGRLVFDVHSMMEHLREVSLAAAVGSPAPDRAWLTRGRSNDRQPAYSPDGDWVAFSSDRAGTLDLWKVSTKTGALARLTEDAADDWDPAFTADGKKMIWSSNRSGSFEIWIAEADGSGARQLSRDGVDAENPTATPDGQWIVYSSANPQSAGVWKIRPDGSDATRLAAHTAVWPEVSPDGMFASYRNATYDWPSSATGHISVRVVRIADGAADPFEIRIEDGLSAGRSRWMPAGGAIAFVAQDEKGVNGVFVQEFAPGRDTTATRRPLAGFDPIAVTESFGISPDGSRMTIAGRQQLSGLMIADHVPGVPARR